MGWIKNWSKQQTIEQCKITSLGKRKTTNKQEQNEQETNPFETDKSAVNMNF